MTVQPSSARAAPAAVSRTQVALTLLAAFLAFEPALRAILWWNADRGGRGLLHGDAMWLQIGFVVLLAGHFAEAARRTARPWLVAGFAAWSVAAVVSTLHAVAPEIARHLNIQWLLHLAFALVLLEALRRTPDAARSLLVGWAIGFLGYAAVLLVFIVGGSDATTDWVWDLPGVANVRHLGFEATAAALVGTLYRPADARAVTLMRVVAVVGWAAVFWSGGRGAVLATVMVTIAAIAMMSPGRRLRIAGEAMAAVVAGAAIASLHAPHEWLGLWRSVQTLEPTGAEVTSGRIAMWRETIGLIVSNPWFGIGEGQAMARLATAGGTFAQPHNALLQVLLAWGVVGGVPVIAAVGVAMWKAIRRTWHAVDASGPALAGLAVASGMMVSAMFDAALYHPRPVMLFLIGLCLALSRR